MWFLSSNSKQSDVEIVMNQINETETKKVNLGNACEGDKMETLQMKSYGRIEVVQKY